MSEIRIKKIEKEIKAYEEAIRNAEGALEEAERELQEELDARYSGSVPEIPEMPRG